MSTFREMSYEELLRWIASGQGGALAAHEMQRRLLSGEATFQALVSAVGSMKENAPLDHDVLVEAFGLLVMEVNFLQPHSFVFLGFNGDGDRTCAVAHFSQVVTKVILRPKRGPERVITGFARL
jgi:hypothetical protein